MFLKDFGYERCKKSIFSKNKAHMKNPIDKKFYLVAYFTPLTAFGKNSKTERQVRFGNHAKNVFLTLIQVRAAKPGAP